MTSVLILVRDYNDSDHILPIAHALGRKGLGVRLLSVNPRLAMETDPRFRIVRGQPDTVVEDALYAEPKNILGWIVSRALKKLRLSGGLAAHKPGLAGRFARRLLWAHGRICDEAWAKRLLRRLKPDAVVLEWGNYAKSALAGFVRAASGDGIPLIAVPHGLNIMWNMDQSWASVDGQAVVPYGEHLRNVDWVICQHRRWADYMTADGVAPEKILVMGSARFCPQWHERLDDAYRNQRFAKGSTGERLKIVYMDHGRYWRVLGDVVETTLQRIAKLDFIDLVIKPSTRNDVYSNPALARLTDDVSDVPSTVLVKWADVVICAASSILVEALLHGKPLIYPKHHHQNEAIIERYGACWQVEDDDGLIEALRHLAGAPDDVPYSQGSVDDFLGFLIGGGRSGRDCLADHAGLIEAVATRNRPVIDAFAAEFGVTAVAEYKEAQNA